MEPASHRAPTLCAVLLEASRWPPSAWFSLWVKQRQRVHIQLHGHCVDGVEREVLLPSLDPGEVARRDAEVLGERLLCESPGSAEVAHLRAQTDLRCFDTVLASERVLMASG